MKRCCCLFVSCHLPPLDRSYPPTEGWMAMFRVLLLLLLLLFFKGNPLSELLFIIPWLWPLLEGCGAGLAMEKWGGVGGKDKRQRRKKKEGRNGRQKQKHPHPDRRRRSSFGGSTCVQHVRALIPSVGCRLRDSTRQVGDDISHPFFLSFSLSLSIPDAPRLSDQLRTILFPLSFLLLSVSLLLFPLFILFILFLKR